MHSERQAADAPQSADAAALRDAPPHAGAAAWAGIGALGDMSGTLEALSPRQVLSLQRAVGNRAVGHLVHGQPPPRGTAGRRLQRALSDEQRKLWDDNDGDAIVAAVKGALDSWKVYRKTPALFADIPNVDRKQLTKLSELVRLNGNAFGEHAGSQLGGDAGKYLTELAAFNSDFNLLVGVVPGVAAVPAGHQYVLKAAGSGSTLEKIFPVGQLTVTYSNAFGWYWAKSLEGTVVSVEVGIGAERSKGKTKPKAGISPPWPGQISINSEATAKATAYWGLDNLEGAVLIANGPSVKGSIAGFGKKVSTGGDITFVGTGGPPTGPLRFANLNTKWDVDTEAPKKPSDVHNPPELSLSLIEAGAGAVWAGPGMDVIATPDLEPQAVPAEKTWQKAIVGFGLGSEVVPGGEGHPALTSLKAEIDEKKHSLETLRNAFEELGLDEEFKLSFYVEGFASRPWQGARGDKERRVENEELSRKRAQGVTALLHTIFGPEHSYDFVGRGPSVHVQEGGPEGETSRIIPEAGNEKEIEDLIRRREKEIAEQFPDMSPQEVKKEARHQLGTGPGAESPAARRVHITATWRGTDIQWAQVATPAPMPRGSAPAPGGGSGGAPGGGSGGAPGGGGGARGAGPDGGGQGSGGAGGA